MAKRGKYRTVGFWRDPKTDREIHGLKRKPDGRFYAAANPLKTFGKDPPKAIKKFRAWESQRTKATVPVLAKLKPILDHAEKIEPYHHTLAAVGGISLDHVLVDADEAALWTTLGRLIRESPKLAAEKTGIEELAYLTDLKPPTPAMNIKDVVTYYANKNQTGYKERKYGKTIWADFLKIIRSVSDAKTINDIAQNHINHYNAVIHQRLSGGKISSKTAKCYFHKVNTILNHAIKKCPEDDKPRLRRVRDLTGSFDIPNGNGNDDAKKIITPAEFHTLLKTAKNMTLAGSGIDPLLWECILLLSLNCCFEAGSLTVLEPKHVDLKRKTLVMRRPKSEHLARNERPVRVAVLWDRTVSAIRRYKLKRPHGLPFLFANCNYRKGGKFTQLNVNTLGNQFDKIRKKAKIDATHKMLRATGFTAALDGGCKDTALQEILMGHNTKSSATSDHYLERHPEMVTEAAKAIEKVYFSQKKGTK